MRTFIVYIDDSIQGAEDDIDEIERKWGAEEIEHKCHNCKHYLRGEYDGSCGSYICENYSGWEQGVDVGEYVHKAESEVEE
jgi:hypothetical protein